MRRSGRLSGGFLLIAGGLAIAGPRVAGLLGSSALVSIPAAGLSLLLGVAIAGLLTKTQAAGRRLALVMLIALVLLPVHVVVTGWMSAIGDQGWLPTWLADNGPARSWIGGYPGAIFLHAIVGTPWAALLSVAALRTVDRRREEQALLETSTPRVLWQVTFRDAAPTLAAVGIVLAVLSAADITITDLLQVRTFAEEVYTQAAAGQMTDWSLSESGVRGLWAGVAMLGVTAWMAITSLLRRLQSNLDAPSVSPWQVSRRWAVGQAVMLHLLVGFLVMVPIASLVQTAGVVVRPLKTGGVERRWEARKTTTMIAAAPWQHRRELGVSLNLALAVATGATLLSAVIAWGTRHRYARLGACLVGLGMAIPGPIIGVVVIRVLNQPPDSTLASLGDLYGTWFAPWLAQMLRLVPLITLLLWPAARRLSEDVIEAARSDGASWLSRMGRIVVPLASSSLIAAWLAAFALSLGELSATILVVPPGTPPLSVRLLSLLHYGVEDRVAAISLVLFAGTTIIAWGIARLVPVGRWLG